MKSNKKRIVVVLAILTMALVLSCALVACDKAGTDKTGTDIAADYKVTIHPNNGQSDIVWDITKAIPTITKDGFHIAGYFLDAQLTISTTLESLKATGITKNIDVYVKWEEHVEATDAAVEPTCTEKGLTEGKHCSKCGKILKAQTEIDALGHDLENHDGQEATCTEKGWKAYVTCKRDGCTYTTYKEIPALGHTEVIDNAIAPTCTEKGKTEGKHCSVCNEVIVAQTDVAALGHDIEHHDKKDATCTEKGWEEYVTCKRDGCSYTTYQEIPALGHDIEHHAEQPATCTEKGWNAYDTCKRNGCTYTTYKEIPAGHKFNENKVCIVCGYFDTGLIFELNEDGESYSVIGISTFSGSSLQIPSVIDNKLVTGIGYNAFSDCIALTSITIPNTIKSIKPSAFHGCTGLANIIVAEDNTKYHSAENCLIETESKTLILGCKSSIIPIDGSVTIIGDYAFWDCTGLTSITIPDSVTYIGSFAFEGTGLTSVTIGNGVTIIGDYAFV